MIVFDRLPGVGGGYTYEIEVLQSLLRLSRESRHDFIIVSNQYMNQSNRPIQDDIPNVQFMPFPVVKGIERIKNSFKMRFPLARMFWKKHNILERELRAAGIELVWCVGANPVLLDLPYIANVWDLQHRLQPFFPEVSENGTWDERESFYSWYLQRAAIIVTGNNAGKEEIEKFYQIPPERIRLLPHMTPDFALNAPKVNVDIHKKYNIPENFLFYPAQFWPHKNHVNLLHAVKILNDKYGLSFPVVFVGSDHGNLNHIKKVIQSLELQSQVYILGFIPREDLIALYQNAFCLTYVSLFGPENMPPLEAFALGCPVIAMRVSGVDEQLGDAALIIENTKPEYISEQIKKLYDDKGLYNQLREKGLERARQWTGDEFVRGIFSILDEFEYIRRCW